MGTDSNLAVTLSAALYDKLAAEARSLGLSVEWLVASLVCDTIEQPEPIRVRTGA